MTVHDTGRFNEGHERAKAVLDGARLGAKLNTDDEIHRATLHVASNAVDAADCRDLLEALGLLSPGYRWIDKGHGRFRKVPS